eukprot:g6658.t1
MLSLFGLFLFTSVFAMPTVTVTYSGKCVATPSSKSSCMEAAETAGMNYNLFSAVYSADYPPGCYFSGEDSTLYYNSYMDSKVECGPAVSSEVTSLSDVTSSDVAARRRLAGTSGCICYQTNLEINSQSYCEQGPTTPSQCQQAAEDLGLEFDWLTPTNSTNLPPGCYYKPDYYYLFFNSNTASKVYCSDSRECICYSETWQDATDVPTADASKDYDATELSTAEASKNYDVNVEASISNYYSQQQTLRRKNLKSTNLLSFDRF